MNIQKIILVALMLSISSISSAADGVIEDGKWEMLEEPMKVGDMGYVFSASVKAEDYESGPLRDMSFQCEFGELQHTIRVIGENLSLNNGAVEYSIDDGPKGTWNMNTKYESGVFLQSKNEQAKESISDLFDHDKLSVFLKLKGGDEKILEFNISGIEDRTHHVRVLCKIS